uniref:Uncharacterized protein n=1 Tax=Chromera velia CCMP2878 TaxID=1169474 RepID=A0A0G4H8X8_9ALVE|eukprot:Cvel_25298.t1-p1 / transcript=Cvel_25298.t1 / gene=Cvel_25298 / organism=Chromera_velia_CCMP2878 / gene_product=hypothetical protein / transcript_product=hypothetical protein / location=Cvel_scaffold2844:21219-22839(+) / protein_length=278 / sequence_SO=supercontig / SO=protein_coding / is_pseudo=false
MLCGWVSFLLGVVAFLSLPWISICQSMLAAQILEFDCTGLKEGTVGRKAWLELQATSIVAEEKFFAEGPVQALKVSLRALQVLSVDPSIPSACPVAASRLFLKAMRFAVAAGQPSRARLLSQIANLFKLQAMSRSVTQCNKKDNEGLQQGKNKTSTASVSSSSSCPAVDGGGTHMGESLPPHSSSSCSTDGVERGNQGSKEANPECEGLQRIWDPHLQSQLSLALIHLGVRGGAGDPASAISWLNHLSMKQQQRQQGGGALQGGGERKKPRIEVRSQE